MRIILLLGLVALWFWWFVAANQDAQCEFDLQNYYDILELDGGASVKEIIKQYHKLSLKHHPDRGGDPMRFIAITEAREALQENWDEPKERKNRNWEEHEQNHHRRYENGRNENAVEKIWLWLFYVILRCIIFHTSTLTNGITMTISAFIPVLSWIRICWTVSTFGIGIFGAIAAFSPKWTFLNDLVKYGKSQSSERSRFHRSIEVPKRWFTHFYMWSTTYTLIVFGYVFMCYYYQSSPSAKIREWLRFFAAPNQKANVSEFAVLLTLACFLVHSFRRLQESLFVSVYSNTNMNILHYIAGWYHYTFVPLTILSEAPGFVNLTQKGIKWEPTLIQIVGLILFLSSNYFQHQCLSNLASMRRFDNGNIITYAHGIPVGGWFKFVSCPHFTFEILIYISLWLTLNLSHRTWSMVVLFVVINQVLAALITHNWYREKYKRTYPASRSALIPYLL